MHIACSNRVLNGETFRSENRCISAARYRALPVWLQHPSYKSSFWRWQPLQITSHPNLYFLFPYYNNHIFKQFPAVNSAGIVYAPFVDVLCVGRFNAVCREMCYIVSVSLHVTNIQCPVNCNGDNLLAYTGN